MLCSLACSPSFSISLSSSKAKKTHLFCPFFGRKERGAETRKPIEEERRRKRANAKTENSTITPRHCCSLFSLRAHLSRETERERRRSKARAVSLSLLFSLLSSSALSGAQRACTQRLTDREKGRESREGRGKSAFRFQSSAPGDRPIDLERILSLFFRSHGRPSAGAPERPARQHDQQAVSSDAHLEGRKEKRREPFFLLLLFPLDSSLSLSLSPPHLDLLLLLHVHFTKSMRNH